MFPATIDPNNLSIALQMSATMQLEHTLDTDHGWLAPDGKLFPCDRHEHSEIVPALRELYNLTQIGLNLILEIHGFVILSDRRFCALLVTASQVKTIRAYAQYHDIPEFTLFSSHYPATKISDLVVRG